MVKTDSSAAGVDLDALDAFLLSDRAPDVCMGLSDLDGFLTGIAVGPEFIMPSECLPVIWGGDKPRFADDGEAQTIIGTIAERYNEIIDNFEASPIRFAPVFLEDREGHTIVTDWAAGFLKAVSLRIEEWNPLIVHPVARSLIVPMFLVGAENQLDLELGERLSADALSKPLENGEELMTICVLGIRDFWLEHSAEPSRKAADNRRGPGSLERRR